MHVRIHYAQASLTALVLSIAASGVLGFASAVTVDAQAEVVQLSPKDVEHADPRVSQVAVTAEAQIAHRASHEVGHAEPWDAAGLGQVEAFLKPAGQIEALELGGEAYRESARREKLSRDAQQSDVAIHTPAQQIIRRHSPDLVPLSGSVLAAGVATPKDRLSNVTSTAQLVGPDHAAAVQGPGSKDATAASAAESAVGRKSALDKPRRDRVVYPIIDQVPLEEEALVARLLISGGIVLCAYAVTLTLTDSTRQRSKALAAREAQSFDQRPDTDADPPGGEHATPTGSLLDAGADLATVRRQAPHTGAELGVATSSSVNADAHASQG